jgi:hypothetical protein
MYTFTPAQPREAEHMSQVALCRALRKVHVPQAHWAALASEADDVDEDEEEAEDDEVAAEAVAAAAGSSDPPKR